jgi:hypothetical protein
LAKLVGERLGRVVRRRPSGSCTELVTRGLQSAQIGEVLALWTSIYGGVELERDLIFTRADATGEASMPKQSRAGGEAFGKPEVQQVRRTWIQPLRINIEEFRDLADRFDERFWERPPGDVRATLDSRDDIQVLSRALNRAQKQQRSAADDDQIECLAAILETLAQRSDEIEEAIVLEGHGLESSRAWSIEKYYFALREILFRAYWRQARAAPIGLLLEGA